MIYDCVHEASCLADEGECVKRTNGESVELSGLLSMIYQIVPCPRTSEFRALDVKCPLTKIQKNKRKRSEGKATPKSICAPCPFGPLNALFISSYLNPWRAKEVCRMLLRHLLCPMEIRYPGNSRPPVTNADVSTNAVEGAGEYV